MHRAVKSAILDPECTNGFAGSQTIKYSHARVLEIASQAGDTLCRWLGAAIQKME